jgi:hypothetical protein
MKVRRMRKERLGNFFETMSILLANKKQSKSHAQFQVLASYSSFGFFTMENLGLLPVRVESSVQLQDVSEPLRAHIARHLEYAAEIQRTLAIREHLIGQFHARKGEFKRSRFALTDPITDQWYSHALFLKRDGLSGFDVFPASFQCELDSLIFQEVEPNAGTPAERALLVDVHYGWGNPVFGEAKRDLLPPEQSWEDDVWSLDKTPHMTYHDKRVVRRYAKQLLDLFEHMVELAKIRNQPDVLRKLTCEHTRIRRIMRGLA